jgi:hypothetical protein
LNSSKKWIEQNELEAYWKDIHLNNSMPDIVIPKLLIKGQIFNNNLIPEQVLTLPIVYNFRNFGSHNIKQQLVIDGDYLEIVRHLIFGLFLAVESL